MPDSSDGVVRIERKGKKEFAFGKDGTPFEVDIVEAFYAWIDVDNSFREEDRTIPDEKGRAYNEAAVSFVKGLMGANPVNISKAEALDFVARLREQYDEVADFFLPKSREERDSPDTSQVPGLQFTAEAS